jgi:hypothetical protein
MIIGLWPWLVHDSLKRFWQSQGVIAPLVLSSIIVLPLHYVMTRWLVFGTTLGFTGAALAMCITQWIILSLLVAFAFARKWYRAQQRQRRQVIGLTLLEDQNGQPDELKVESSLLSTQTELNEDQLVDWFNVTNQNAHTMLELTQTHTLAPHLHLDSLLPYQHHLSPQEHSHQLSLPPNKAEKQELCLGRPSSTNTTAGSDESEIKQPIHSHVNQVSADDVDDDDSINPDDNWPPLSTDIFRGWGEYFKLGAPSAISLVLEWGSYEASAWAAGLIDSKSLAIHTIFMQTAAIWYV